MILVSGMENQSRIEVCKSSLHALQDFLVAGAFPHLPSPCGRVVCKNGVMEFLLVQFAILVLVGTSKKRLCKLISRLTPKHDSAHCQLLERQKAIHVCIGIKEPDETMCTTNITFFHTFRPCR